VAKWIKRTARVCVCVCVCVCARICVSDITDYLMPENEREVQLSEKKEPRPANLDGKKEGQKRINQVPTE
jgi:hypothetical protein